MLLTYNIPYRTSSRPKFTVDRLNAESNPPAEVSSYRLLGGQGTPWNSGWAPGVGSVNRHPNSGELTAPGARILSPAGRFPVSIHLRSAANPADSSLVVYPQWVTSRIARPTNKSPS